jgi:hypothetical protein
MQDFNAHANPVPASVEPACGPESSLSAHRKIACPNGKLELILQIRRSQLIHLFHHRGQLRDDDIGRDNLRLLLELGLTGPDAYKVAPWISVADLSRLIDEVDRFPQFWTADGLGSRVELTFKEKLELDIRNIGCFDKPKHEVDAFYRKRRRERDAERKRQKRRAGKKKNKAKVSARAKAVLEILNTEEWMSTGEIADRVSTVPVFANLNWEGMRQAIGRAVNELKKATLAQDQMERIYGEGVLGYMTRCVRSLEHK